MQEINKNASGIERASEDLINYIAAIEQKESLQNQEIRDKFKVVKFSPRGEDMPPKYEDGSFRRKKNTQEYRFMHENRQISVYGKTKQICWNKRTEIINNKDINKKNAYTVEEWFTKWANEFKKNKLAPNSWTNMLYQLNYIIKAIGSIKLSRLSAIEIQTFLNNLKSSNVRKKVSITINAALKKAAAMRIIKFNPFDAVEPVTHQKRHYPVITIKHQDIIYKNALPEYQKVFMLCCCTGLRIGEALGLQPQDIDFKRNVITIKRQRGRDGTATEILKTKSAYREIPFLPKLLKSFDLSSEFLIAERYAAIDSYFGRLFKKLDMKGYVLHSFRHTFISTLYHLGVRDKQIQVWAGHSQIETTLNTYTHLLESGTSVVTEYLNELIASTLKVP